MRSLKRGLTNISDIIQVSVKPYTFYYYALVGEQEDGTKKRGLRVPPQQILTLLIGKPRRLSATRTSRNFPINTKKGHTLVHFLGWWSTNPGFLLGWATQPWIKLAFLSMRTSFKYATCTLLSCKQGRIGEILLLLPLKRGKDEVFLILERNHCGDKREIKTTDKKLKSMNGMMVEEKSL